VEPEVSVPGSQNSAIESYPEPDESYFLTHATSSGIGRVQHKAGLWGWTAAVRLPAGARDFLILHSVQIGSGAHAVSCLVGIWGYFPAMKRLGLEADHSLPSGTEVKNDRAIPPLPHTSSWRSA
jgi:hypothetical protein